MAFFKKKEFEALPEMPADLGGLPPIPELPSFSQAMTQPQLRDLTTRGYPSTDVLAGMQAAPMRSASAPAQTWSQLPPIPAPPSFRPTSQPSFMAKPATEEIEEIAEAIISERWQKISKDFDELKRSQEDLSSAISGVQERITSVEKKMDMVIQEILGKVEEYGKGISDVGTELKAMQRVFGTVMPTFTENIKELQEMVGEAKEKGFKKRKAKRR
jgi:uncharacterized protein YoxC